jgi:hypothetical protein
VADGWCWFVLREKYCWLVADGWFVLREKYCWLVADKPSEQGARCPRNPSNTLPYYLFFCKVTTVLVRVYTPFFCKMDIFTNFGSGKLLLKIPL